MLRLVAEHAHMWNVFADSRGFAHKAAVLDEWCARVGRDPAEIERTTTLRDTTTARCREYVEAGVGQIVVASGVRTTTRPCCATCSRFATHHNG